jgi:hypothetical protein
MSADTQLVLWLAGSHIVGLACFWFLMLPALRHNPAPPERRPDGEGDDGGWGRGPKLPPTPPKPPRGGIPLPDAAQSRVRLRDHVKLTEKLTRRGRRPTREPSPAPGREPARPLRLPVRSPERSPHR